MSKNNNIYIPYNVEKENIDFSGDTKDGRDTATALNLAVFQQKSGPEFEISQNCSSLTLEENSFNDLLYSEKPNKKDYSRNALCSIESYDKITRNMKQLPCSGY